MKKIISVLTGAVLLSSSVFALSPAFEPNYESFENYAGKLELLHGYEITQSEIGGSVEVKYKGNLVTEYTGEDYEISNIVESSFTVSTNKGDYLINHNGIYLNGKFLQTIEDSPLLTYEEEYLSVPKGVFHLFGKRNYDQEKGVRGNVIEALKIRKAKPATFKVWSSQITSDDNKVYYDGEIIEGIDGGTFESLGGGYYGEDSVVYYGSLKNKGDDEYYKMLNNVDIYSFELLKYGYAKDKDNILIDGEVLDGDYDIATFGFVHEDLTSYSRNSILTKDKNNVYLGNEIISSDPANFQAYTSKCGKDLNTLYCSSNKGIVKREFEDIDSVMPIYRDGTESVLYWRDAEFVYDTRDLKPICAGGARFGDEWKCRGELISSDSFEHLTNWYIKDANQVLKSYSAISLLEGADAQTFIAWPEVSDHIARDKNHVYFKYKTIDFFDSITFEPLGHNYYKDKNGIYYGIISERRMPTDGNSLGDFKLFVEVELIQGADIGSFEIIGNDSVSGVLGGGATIYAKDKSYVYSKGKPVQGANPDDFNPQNPYGVKQGEVEIDNSSSCTSSISYNNEKVCCDDIVEGNNFTQLGDIYAKTDKKIYGIASFPNKPSLCRELDVDAKTFEIISPVNKGVGGDSQFSYGSTSQGFGRGGMGIFSKDKNNIYFSLSNTEICENVREIDVGYTICGNPLGAYVVEGADVDLFVNLDNHYGLDATNVYYGIELIDEADVTTFDLTPNMSDGYMSNFDNPMIQNYGIDKNYVFNQGKIMNGVSSQGFEALSPTVFKDQENGVYKIINNEVMSSSADYNTFTYDSTRSIRYDKDGVYAVGDSRSLIKKYPGADIESFQNVDCGESENYCYHSYVKDENNVYMRHSTEVIDGADADTFEYFGSLTYARDKNSIYRNGKRLDLDSTNAVEYPKNVSNYGHSSFITDGVNVYRGDKLMTETSMSEFLGQGRNDGEAIMTRLEELGLDMSQFNKSSDEIASELKIKYDTVYDHIDICLDEIVDTTSENMIDNRPTILEGSKERFYEELDKGKYTRLSELERIYDNLIGWFDQSCVPSEFLPEGQKWMGNISFTLIPDPVQKDMIQIQWDNLDQSIEEFEIVIRDKQKREYYTEGKVLFSDKFYVLEVPDGSGWDVGITMKALNGNGDQLGEDFREIVSLR